MPLRKLWNSLMGRPEEPASVQNAAADASPDQQASGQKPNVPVTRAERPAEAARSVLSLASRPRPDGLSTLVMQKLKSADGPRRILEIGIGDGSRTSMLISQLVAEGVQPERLSYIVLDQFEIGGGLVSLRDFHGRLRGVAPRPSIVPDTLTVGLPRILHRHGLVDVVIVDPSVPDALLAEHEVMLSKLQQPGAMLLRQTSGRWSETNAHRRVA